MLTDAEERARRRLCIALDGLDSVDAVRGRVEELRAFAGMFKIGSGLFTRFGPEAVRLVRGMDADVFLDLKFHDIPNTVREAVRAAAGLGVSMLTVHASGGPDMLRAAMEGARGDDRPKVIGVTVLTSLDDDALSGALRVPGPMGEHVLHLARMAEDCGLDGIVCSAADLGSVRDRLPDLLCVTPGIRGPTAPAGADQRRVSTPGRAIGDGASVLVVGRAITAHGTPEGRRRAAREVLRDMALRA